MSSRAASLDAMPVDCGTPRLFHRATEWKKCMDDFFDGQLEVVPLKGGRSSLDRKLLGISVRAASIPISFGCCSS
jgi:hypothetical protein